VERLLFDEAYFKCCLELIKAAQREVLLSSFIINFGAYKKETKVVVLMRELKEAAARGVTVKILLSSSQRGKAVGLLNATAVRFLSGCPAEVHFLPHGRCCHAKFLVVDYRYGVIGSHNWTRWALEENFELSIGIKDLSLLEEIRIWFYRLFDSALPWQA